MIRLRKYNNESIRWAGRFVWVNPDHITFLSFDPEDSTTTVTCIGGGQIRVLETPQLILAMVPAKSE